MNMYRVRVYFEDTDCGQVVYHTNYIKYCERARSEMFFIRDISPIEGQSGFVVKHLNADFIMSARLGDLLEIRTKVVKLKNASVELMQEVYRIHNASQQKACEERVFVAGIVLAFVDASVGRVCKIPQQIVEMLKDED